MAAKKSAIKKRKNASASRKKVAAKRVSRKRPSKKKATRSGAHKATRSGAQKVAKKVAKKKVAKKVAKKKVAKKVAKKASKKKPARKKVAKKKATRSGAQKAAPKKTAARNKVAHKAPVRRTRSRGDVLSGPIHGIDPYNPRRGENYMSGTQLGHFQEILNAWKRELMFEVDRTVHHMQDEAANFPDPNDRATQESEFGLELRTRDRERKLLRKIDSALARIDDGSYGFCDETGEEIGLKRLEARPVATLSLEAQERRELAERQFRDRDDRYR